VITIHFTIHNPYFFFSLKSAEFLTYMLYFFFIIIISYGLCIVCIVCIVNHKSQGKKWFWILFFVEKKKKKREINIGLDFLHYTLYTPYTLSKSGKSGKILFCGFTSFLTPPFQIISLVKI
jgi:hypothetical protein